MIFFDTADRLAHGNARRVGTLDELLEQADVVTLHVDGRPGNAGLFGAAQFAKMKPRSMFINASRGMVVDDVALREHILSGHIAGAALDVFPVEPKAQGDEFESALRGLPNVILTPHVGGSTQEAQEEIGYFVSGKLSALRPRRQHGALGEPARGRGARRCESGFRIALLHHNVPGVLASVNQVLADQQANVTAQYLATRGEQGYVVTDVATELPDSALDGLRDAESTIWLRTYRPERAALSDRAAARVIEVVPQQRRQPVVRTRRSSRPPKRRVGGGAAAADSCRSARLPGQARAAPAPVRR